MLSEVTVFLSPIDMQKLTLGIFYGYGIDHRYFPSYILYLVFYMTIGAE
jgi:hypothetical protein